MHYHPIPQEPGDFYILCPDHVGTLEENYLCDCPSNRCYQCEEDADSEAWSKELQQT